MDGPDVARVAAAPVPTPGFPARKPFKVPGLYFVPATQPVPLPSARRAADSKLFREGKREYEELVRLRCGEVAAPLAAPARTSAPAPAPSQAAPRAKVASIKAVPCRMIREQEQAIKGAQRAASEAQLRRQLAASEARCAELQAQLEEARGDDPAPSPSSQAWQLRLRVDLIAPRA